MYKRKTKDEYQIHQYINGAWEEVTAESKIKEARDRLKEYRENQPEYPVKIVIKRIPLTELDIAIKTLAEKEKEPAKQYIIDQIDNSGYSDAILGTITDKIKFLRETFYAEYGWHVKQSGEQIALREWFMGLPTSCTIEWRNHKILEIAKTWGSLPDDATEKQEDKILDNWFNFMAAKTGQLFRKYTENKS